MRPQLLLTAMLASLLLCAIAAATLTRAAIDYRRQHLPALAHPR
jgi:hypothetical protein